MQPLDLFSLEGSKPSTTSLGGAEVGLACALERAVRYRAFSWSAVERILAAQARPRSDLEALTVEAKEQLDEILQQAPLASRSPAEYQALLEEMTEHDEKERGKDEDSDPGEPLVLDATIFAIGVAALFANDPGSRL